MNIITNKRHLTGCILGIIGSIMGFYIWQDYIPVLGEDQPEWIGILRLEHVIFLFIPSCIALVSSLYNKSHLMFLALLISLPTTKYLGIKPLIFPDNFPLVYYPSLCYLISAFFMIKINKKSS